MWLGVCVGVYVCAGMCEGGGVVCNYVCIHTFTITFVYTYLPTPTPTHPHPHPQGQVAHATLIHNYAVLFVNMPMPDAALQAVFATAAKIFKAFNDQSDVQAMYRLCAGIYI